MQYRNLLFFAALIFLFSCKKEKTTNPHPPGPPPPAVKLKDVTLSNLPSPYYHFEYDSSGRVSFASFASEFERYNVFYSGGLINEMRNNILVNKDRLQYFYNSNGKVEAINYADSTGNVYTRIDLFYEGEKLVKLEREKKVPGGFVLDKRLLMSYDVNGNLVDINYLYPAVDGQSENNFTTHFEQYDNKINVDAFDLLHNDFFDHLFLLPGVQLQKNNPGKETRTGDGINYTVNYTYIYNNSGLPLTKNGQLTVTNGTNAGQVFQTSSAFTYY